MSRAAPRRHAESHLVQRIGWLRAAVLGANDGILSTASLIVGVASAAGTHQSVIVAGFAGLVAGAMSMAAGEYVSVSSQSDTERADLARERGELSRDAGSETEELAGIYVQRSLETDLALQVAQQLMARDALGAHARDELGISDTTTARPIQAALTSAASFAAGAALPLLTAAYGAGYAFQPACGGCVGGVAAVLGGAGRRRRQGRRGEDIRRHYPGHVLGCACDGVDGGSRCRVWDSGLTAVPPVSDGLAASQATSDRLKTGSFIRSMTKASAAAATSCSSQKRHSPTQAAPSVHFLGGSEPWSAISHPPRAESLGKLESAENRLPGLATPPGCPARWRPMITHHIRMRP